MKSFIDNPQAPLLYADAVSGWAIAGGNVRITLETIHFDHNNDEAVQSSLRVVIGKLVMPLASAVAMANGILQFAEQQRRSAESTAEHAASQGSVN